MKIKQEKLEMSMISQQAVRTVLRPSNTHTYTHTHAQTYTPKTKPSPLNIIIKENQTA